MELTIKSKKLDKNLVFTMQGQGAIYVDLNGEKGTLGLAICESGKLTGKAISCPDSDFFFKIYCQRWYSAYVRRVEKERDGSNAMSGTDMV